MASKSRRYKDKPSQKHRFGAQGGRGRGRGASRLNENQEDHRPQEEEEKNSSGSECEEDSDEIVRGDSGRVSNTPMKLYMWYFEQCDPKKCSGFNLKRLGMLETLPLTRKFNGLVLTPATDRMISMADADLLTEFGVAVIDCSWAFFDSVKVKSNKSRERILPNLLAANPINYGKEFKLNCAEALAAAYFLCGFEEQAQEIMSRFKWGPAFFAVNEYRLERYRGCATGEEMLQAQVDVLADIAQEKEENRNRAIDMPSSDSDDEEEQAYLQSIRDRNKEKVEAQPAVVEQPSDGQASDEGEPAQEQNQAEPEEIKDGGNSDHEQASADEDDSMPTLNDEATSEVN